MSNEPPKKKFKQSQLSFASSSHKPQVVCTFPGYTVTNVPSDDNCQFSSLALQLGFDSSSSHEIRQEIVEYLRTNKVADANINMDDMVEEYGSYSVYLSKMSEPGTWGDGLTLAGAAAVYKRPIIVVCNTGSTFTIDSPTYSDAAEPMTLGYIGAHNSLLKFHYVSLKKIVTKCSSLSPTTCAARNKDMSHPVKPASVAEERKVELLPENIISTSEKICNLNKNVFTSKNDKIILKRQIDFPWLSATNGGALCIECALNIIVTTHYHQITLEHS